MHLLRHDRGVCNIYIVLSKMEIQISKESKCYYSTAACIFCSCRRGSMLNKIYQLLKADMQYYIAFLSAIHSVGELNRVKL